MRKTHEAAPLPGGRLKSSPMYCLCPECGYKMKHAASQPCRTIECPKCGGTMQRGVGVDESRSELRETITALRSITGGEEPVVEFTKDLDKSSAAKDVKKANRLATGLYSETYLAFNTLRNSNQHPEVAIKLRDLVTKIGEVQIGLKGCLKDLK